MKTIQFTLFGREILLRYVFHITKKGKPLRFQSLVFKEIVNDDFSRSYKAEMRIGGAYLINVSLYGNGYHVEVYKSGELMEIISYCTKEEVTALMQMIQNGEYKEPSNEFETENR